MKFDPAKTGSAVFLDGVVVPVKFRILPSPGVGRFYRRGVRSDDIDEIINAFLLFKRCFQVALEIVFVFPVIGIFPGGMAAPPSPVIGVALIDPDLLVRTAELPFRMGISVPADGEVGGGRRRGRGGRRRMIEHPVLERTPPANVSDRTGIGAFKIIGHDNHDRDGRIRVDVRIHVVTVEAVGGLVPF